MVFGCTGLIFLTGAQIQFITVDQLNQILRYRRMGPRSAGSPAMSSSAAMAASSASWCRS
jgi:hypothetical protein